jgi:putative endonuclease
MHYTYVLKNNRTNKLYYGYTNNIERRFKEHNNGHLKWTLIYYEAYRTESDARVREKRLKHYAQTLTALKSRLSESLKC